jgi:hypothetical protein
LSFLEAINKTLSKRSSSSAPQRQLNLKIDDFFPAADFFTEMVRIDENCGILEKSV